MNLEFYYDDLNLSLTRFEIFYDRQEERGEKEGTKREGEPKEEEKENVEFSEYQEQTKNNWKEEVIVVEKEKEEEEKGKEELVTVEKEIQRGQEHQQETIEGGGKKEELVTIEREMLREQEQELKDLEMIISTRDDAAVIGIKSFNFTTKTIVPKYVEIEPLDNANNTNRHQATDDTEKTAEQDSVSEKETTSTISTAMREVYFFIHFIYKFKCI